MGNKLNRQIKNKSNNKTKRIVIKDKKKLYRTVGIFIVILVLIVAIFTFRNRDVKIDNNTNIQKVNLNKYSSEVKLYYEGIMNEFITDCNNINSAAWTYIYNNIVNDKEMESLVEEVNNILLSDDWSIIGMEKNTKWRGIYRIDKTNNVLLFKFETKEIEPTWINDTTVNYMIEKN